MTPEAAAFQQWLDLAFLDYHRDWIFDTTPVAVAVKARQIAFSSATAGGAVFWGLGAARPQLILSASQDLSDEVLAKARSHCELLAASGHRGATDYSVDNATEIAWRSGGRIVALPANPRTARSFAGDTWLDEAAYHSDLEGIRDGAFAMVSTGDYRLRIFSTPNGAQGLFHDWVTKPPDGWSVRSVTIDDAIAQGFPVDIDKLMLLAGGDDRVFAQWYRCSFLDADLQYIPSAIADRALRWIGTVPDISSAKIVAGFDVGRHHDLSVLTILAVVGRIAYVLAIVPMKRTAFAAQRRSIAEFRSAFQWETLHVDKTGIGEEMAEELIEQYGAEEVKPVAFTNDSKSDLATRALRWLRDGRLRLPKENGTPSADAKKLHADMVALRRKITASGNVVYESPKTAQGHGDRFWSLGLALKGAGEPSVFRGMEPSGSRLGMAG